MTIKTRSAEPKAETKPARKVLSRKSKVGSEAVTDVAPVDASAQPGVAVEDLDRPVTGRGVFAVRTLGNAVSVEAAILAQDGNVLRLPAVFPNREYALGQVDELRALINQHFDGIDHQGSGSAPAA